MRDCKTWPRFSLYSLVKFQMKLLAYLCLALILGFPQLSFGCRPIVGHEYPVPTEAELFAKADLVFLGTVIQLREAPEFEEVTRHPFTVVLTMKVQKWDKGSEGELLQVIDTAGTDCDSLAGVFHVELPNRNAVPSPGWRIFAKKSNGRIFVITVSHTK